MNAISGLIGTGLIVVLVISFMQYRNLKLKQSTNALLQKLEKELTQAVYEKNLAQAEMLATRIQVNPHFLFNCLNSIKYQIQKKENDQAIKYLVVFSRFIRMVLETSRQDVISLKEELELTNYYLTLEKNRFNDDFTFQINSLRSELLQEITIPPLLIQSFIESAIWHGLLPSVNEEKRLVITVSFKNGGLEIRIDDNGVKRKLDSIDPKVKASIGTEIVQERIDLFNKTNDSKIQWKIIDKVDEIGLACGTIVVISLFYVKGLIKELV